MLRAITQIRTTLKFEKKCYKEFKCAEDMFELFNSEAVSLKSRDHSL